MSAIKSFTLFLLYCAPCLLYMANAQISSGVYISEDNGHRHELKIDSTYLTYTDYGTSPAQFIKTLGGFWKVEDASNKILNVKLEFNSDYQKDSLRMLNIPMKMEGENLILDWFSKLVFEPVPGEKQDLDGTWLFATRGPDEGQERRGDENPRKTLKYLQDGRFQWIAYNTDTFEFFGTGGGSFTSKDGEYIENIEYFSRDKDRVGAELSFNYELKNDDWHHTGKNSKGEPMYEIWARR